MIALSAQLQSAHDTAQAVIFCRPCHPFSWYTRECGEWHTILAHSSFVVHLKW